MKYSYSSQTFAIAPTRSVNSTISPTDAGLGFCILTLPLILVVAVLGYRHHRAKKLQLQVLRLERLWHLSAGHDSIKE